MSLLDKAVEHGSSQPLRPIEVPEWGETLWVGVYTIREAAQINGTFAGDMNHVPATIMVRAKQENGEPAFDVGAVTLKRLKEEVDAAVLMRIHRQMTERPEDQKGDPEKK